MKHPSHNLWIGLLLIVCFAPQPAIATEPIAVIRGKILPGETGDPSGVKQYSQIVLDLLDTSGLRYATLDDTALLKPDITQYKLLILPHNPRLTVEEVRALHRYGDGGGKILLFYNLPEQLAPRMGIRAFAFHKNDETQPFSFYQPVGPLAGLINQPVFAGSWAAHVPGELAENTTVLARWHNGRGQPTPHPAIIESPAGIFVGHILLATDIAPKRRLLTELIGRLLPDQLPVMREALAAKQNRTHAALAAMPRVDHTLRGVWLDLRDPMPDPDWATTIQRIADAGMTDVFVLVATGGLAHYPSDLLPVAKGINAGNDPLARVIAAAKPRGLKVHAWKVCWNMADAPADFVKTMRDAGRLQVSVRGPIHEQWLTPSHWSNFVLERDTLLELVRRYDLVGIHLDFVRYPNSDYDYSPVARKRFEEHIRQPIANWPLAVRAGPLQPRFIAWRQEQITRLVREVSKEARALKPGVQISTAVFPHYPATIENIGQNWLDWCQRGYVDFVCPMNYTRDDKRFENWITEHLNYARSSGIPVYPGIGATVMAWQEPIETARQIQIAREAGATGYVLFHYDHTLARQHLPLLHQSVNRPQP